jgi:hypothetical protein
MAGPFMERKSSQIVLLILALGIGVFSIFGFIGMVRQTHTRAVARDWGVALRESEKVPSGLGRAEDLLARLKRIDTGYAPDELKRAIADYINALEGSLDAAKAGRDTTSYDEAMDQAKQRMVAAAKKYD